MSAANPAPHAARTWIGPVLWTVATGVVLVGTLLAVNLTPRVEQDFFFSADDPQLRVSREITETFPSGAQILVRAAAPDITSDDYRSQVDSLTVALTGLPDVESVRSVTTERADRSPLWSRLLLPEDGEASNLVVTPRPTASPAGLVRDLEEVLAAARAPGFDLQMSGVPVVLELIRRSLARDLAVFSLGALVLFGLLVGVIERSATIVLGTLATSLLACALTLLLKQALGIPIGLLTANILTIVFVLTLSHTVFLTANGRREGAARAVRVTLPASLWAMLTTLLGFLSLLLGSARPLRELGAAGAIGTITALLTAYLAYPTFLAHALPAEPDAASVPGWRPPRATRLALLALAVGVAVVGRGVLRLDTDPGLLSYFAPASDLHHGLSEIDADGGSSTLDLVVRLPEGGRLDTPEALERMNALQDSLETVPEVGVTLSPSVLYGHARLQPLASLLPLPLLSALLDTEALGGVGRSFLTEDRERARFSLRMHEGDAGRPRAQVLADIDRVTTAVGLEPVTVGGVYDLQRQLGLLIVGSLRIGLGGLLVLFLGIGLAVSGSLRTTGALFLCLLAIPLVVLGAFGTLGVPVDIITSPAANLALALGVDAMIHITLRHRATGDWATAARQMARPVLSATAIVCAGFGLFVISSFPPTARFGMAVILGTVTAGVMALVVLPSLADGGERAA